MINISLQRNDNKAVSDKVSYTDNTIILNGIEYKYQQGALLDFVDDAYRDDTGELHCTVVLQYVGADKDLAESNKEAFIKQQWSTDVKESVDVDVKTISEEELVENELAEVDAEMQAIRQAVLDEMIDERLGVSND